MVDVIQEKHGITLDQADPILLLGTLAAELNQESRDEFARIAAELSDQVAAALVLADTTAKARSERLITEAAKWSAEQIRGAGAEVLEQIDATLQHRWVKLNWAGIAIGIGAALVFGVICGGAGYWFGRSTEADKLVQVPAQLGVALTGPDAAQWTNLIRLNDIGKASRVCSPQSGGQACAIALWTKAPTANAN
jgi:hypothetical protein